MRPDLIYSFWGRAFPVALMTASLAACETLVPLALNVGRNLLSTAAYNHSPRYAELLEDLIGKLAENQATQMTGFAPVKPMPIQVASRRPIEFEAAILAQRMSADGRRMPPVPIQDGAKLRDGRGDPKAGDTLKISFSLNCDCYAYVVAIDATGYVEQVFPSRDLPYTNPVLPNRQYVVPEGTVWYGLDDYRGIENVYFVASHERREDLEAVIDQLAAKGRGKPANYRSVSKAAVITRGLVKTRLAGPTSIQAESGENFRFSPDTFISTVSGKGLAVVTKWFQHE